MSRGYTLVRRLRSDQQGATLVEFALIAPVMCMLLLGAFDMGHTLYMRSVLQGIVQKTARDSTLEQNVEASARTTIDNRVRTQVTAIANNADVVITRRFYRTFSDVAAARAEAFTDSTAGKFKNGVCDNGEPYEDANGNQTWDRDGGNEGQGGAKDATLYTVTVSYPRFFPIDKFIGGDATTKVVASTVLKNQPYANQGSYAPPVLRNCP